MPTFEELLLEHEFVLQPDAFISEGPGGLIRFTTDKRELAWHFQCYGPLTLPTFITKRFSHGKKRILVITYEGKIYLRDSGMPHEKRGVFKRLEKRVFFTNHVSIPEERAA